MAGVAVDEPPAPEDDARVRPVIANRPRSAYPYVQNVRQHVVSTPFIYGMEGGAQDGLCFEASQGHEGWVPSTMLKRRLHERGWVGCMRLDERGSMGRPHERGCARCLGKGCLASAAERTEVACCDHEHDHEDRFVDLTIRKR